MVIQTRNEKTEAYGKLISLLDPGSFMEIGAHISARLTRFYDPKEVVESDGVITGYGTIDGQLVYIFAQDGDVMGGSFGEMHGRKILNLYQHALKARAPIVGLLDCQGFRIEEGLDGLNLFGQLYSVQAQASRSIPQIMAVIGRCGGGMSFSAEMADFTLVEKERGELFVNPQSIVENSIGDNPFTEATDDGTYPWEELVTNIRELVEILPPSAAMIPEPGETTDDLNRLCPNLAALTGDGRGILREISDEGYFLEIRPAMGEDMVTGFIKLDGYPIGAIACNTVDGEKKLSVKGVEKATNLIEVCSRFNIPLLFIIDTEGYRAGVEEEKYLPWASSKMIKALTAANVPKVNLITGSNFGSAYSMMNSKGMGADYVFMWDTAEVSIVNPRQAIEMLYGSYDEEKEREYQESCSSATALARRGYADRIIKPEETRKYLTGAFETFVNSI